MMAADTIKVGVVGVGRGLSFAKGAPFVGMELVALCDTWEAKLRDAAKLLHVAAYTDFDTFLAHDMDAVILANYFHEHAPFAMKALAAGKHVMSETMACKTPAEGVALARAVERSGRIYMFSENYPYFAYNQEMRRLYQAGEVGEMQYGEGEYIHPMAADDINRLAPGVNHWRNWIPSTYYCSHALAPIMHITGTRPVSVNAQSIAKTNDETARHTARRGDIGSVILCRMDNGAVVRLLGLLLRGHGNFYRIHGARGLMENLRTNGNQQKLRIVHEEWDMRAGDVREKIIVPNFPHHDEDARRAGHAGGDFFVNFHFAEAIRRNEPPYLDVYRGLDMAMVGIQAWRSCLDNGAPYDVPDFRFESVRQPDANDHFSPWPEDAAPGQPPPSIRGWNEPPPAALSRARQVWRDMGYEA